MKGATEPISGGASESLKGTRVAVLGCGAVGSSFAIELQRAGAKLSLWSRRRRRAEELSRRLGGVSVMDDPAAAAGEAQLVVLCVADRVLESLCLDLAPRVETREGGPAWFHTNGFHGLSVLSPFADRGLPVGKLHPLAAIPAAGQPERIRGAWFATAADPRAQVWLQRLLEAVQGRELRLGGSEQDSRRLHAAATLLAGGTVALFHAASLLARSAAAKEGSVSGALRALLHSTCANLDSLEPGEALTGPVVRGSVELVRGHIDVLERDAPAFSELYRALGKRMLELARAQGTLEEDDARELERLFEERSRR